MRNRRDNESRRKILGDRGLVHDRETLAGGVAIVGDSVRDPRVTDRGLSDGSRDRYGRRPLMSSLRALCSLPVVSIDHALSVSEVNIVKHRTGVTVHHERGGVLNTRDLRRSSGSDGGGIGNEILCVDALGNWPVR